VFQRLAVAEGKIHGLPAEQVHFHEVGAVDSIVDIVGACVALEFFGKPRVLASAVVDGCGWIDCAHGRFPIPAPATLEILAARGVPISQCEEPHELITPTGAALLAEFAVSFGPMRVWFRSASASASAGATTKPGPTWCAPSWAKAPGHGRTTGKRTRWPCWKPTWTTPTPNGWVILLTKHGGRRLDVCQTPAQMKKNRPASCSRPVRAGGGGQIQRMDFAAHQRFGVRRTLAERRKLRREFRAVQTPFGEVSVKIGKLDGQGRSDRAGI
jgi:uncharacterized protein (DUF111 family)